MTAASNRKVHRNSPERAAMLADRAREQRRRFSRFTPVSGKARLSTKGERRETWRTKRWTEARRPSFAKAEA